MSLLSLIADALPWRQQPPPEGDLIDWENTHADPHGDVWEATVMGDDWTLFQPGAVNVSAADPKKDIFPLSVKIGAAACPRSMSLRKASKWLVPWVEQVSGGTVVEAAEGWRRFGPDYDQARYVIYLKVAT